MHYVLQNHFRWVWAPFSYKNIWKYIYNGILIKVIIPNDVVPNILSQTIMTIVDTYY